MSLPEIRIVSLIASATEIVTELGLLPRLVGRSHECDYPASVLELPSCTRARFDTTGSSLDIDQRVKDTLTNALSVYEVFDDVLERLQPTHILTQSQCEVCAVSLRDVERSVASRLASRPRILSLSPNRLEDIWQDIRDVGMALGVDPAATISKLQNRMSRAGTVRHPRPRMACIEWIEPLMAAGNWVPELVEMAGAENVLGEAGKHSPWMTWADLLKADPDVIVTMPCGFDIPRTLSEMYWLTERSEWQQLRAVRAGRVYVADGNQFFNRPGPRVAESLEILVEIANGISGPWRGIGYVPYAEGLVRGDSATVPSTREAHLR